VGVDLDLRESNGATRRPKVAFVLGGGGNLGAVQVGMLHALLERGIAPDLVVGCSVGALNGAAIAGDPTLEGAERLGDVWCGLDGASLIGSGSNLASIWSLLRRGQSLSSNDGLRRLLHDASPIKTFEEAVVPLHVVATSLETGDERWFTTGSIVAPILASAALPAVYPPVDIDGELHVDGAVVNNVPISRAVALGAERIYVCHVGNFTRPRGQPKRPIDVLLQSFSIARNHRFQSEHTRPWPDVELVVLPAIDPGKIGRNDFRRTPELIRRGRESAGRFLDNSTSFVEFAGPGPANSTKKVI
jgi:NTE family protein